MVCNKTEHHLPFWFFLLAVSAIHKHRCFLNLNDVCTTNNSICMINTILNCMYNKLM